MNITQKCQPSATIYSSILSLSSWGFIITIVSFLFLYAGYWVDQYFGTSPTFMLGLFLLAVFMSVWKLYYEAWQRRKRV